MSFLKLIVQASKQLGRPKEYTPEGLLEKFIEYVKWNDENPWKINELIKDPKKLRSKQVSKDAVIPLTQGNFQIFAGISRSTWDNYVKQPKFFAVTEHILESIRGHKYAGASINVYNANIIARDLGLVDKQNVDSNLSVQWNETKTYENKTDENSGKQTKTKKSKS